MAEEIEKLLGEAVLEQIRWDQYKVDQKFWPYIADMQVSLFAGMALDNLLPTSPPTPLMPRTPHKLFALLSQYAIELFDCEYRLYPKTIDSAQWAANLATKTENLVMHKISLIDAKPTLRSITWHAPLADIQPAVGRVLMNHAVASRPALSLPMPVQLLTRASHRSSVTPPSTAPEKSLNAVGARQVRRSEKISPILKAKGWTLSKWATRAGIDPSIVYDYMKGISSPRPATRNDLADALEIDRLELPD
jgi:hypothetical protein